jgi:hypothetical protein
MIQRERRFQYLVALAVAGQMSDAEFEELSEHMANCSSCSQRMAEMEPTNLQLFLTLAAQVKGPRFSSKMQERFLIRAAQSGVPMAAPSSGFQRSTFLHFAALLVAACLFSGLGWRHLTHSSLERTNGSSSPMKIAARLQISTKESPNSAILEVPVVDRSINRRCNCHAPDYAATLSSFATDKESRVVPRSLFRLDPAFFPSQPRAINTEARLRGLQHLTVECCSSMGAGLTPRFPVPIVPDSSMNDGLNNRIFRYSATLASISLQDDQAVFGLTPRVRDISFSSTLDSNRPR